jgi:hypothetical protein
MSFLNSGRFHIGGALLIAALMFLTVTTSIENILFNAVVSEFVLSIDEPFYLALLPSKTRRLLLLFKLIPITHGVGGKGLDRCMMAVGAFSVSLLAFAFGALCCQKWTV